MGQMDIRMNRLSLSQEAPTGSRCWADSAGPAGPLPPQRPGPALPAHLQAPLSGFSLASGREGRCMEPAGKVISVLVCVLEGAVSGRVGPELPWSQLEKGAVGCEARPWPWVPTQCGWLLLGRGAVGVLAKACPELSPWPDPRTQTPVLGAELGVLLPPTTNPSSFS